VQHPPPGPPGAAAAGRPRAAAAGSSRCENRRANLNGDRETDSDGDGMCPRDDPETEPPLLTAGAPDRGPRAGGTTNRIL
jgi:hypothetical protein